MQHPLLHSVTLLILQGAHAGDQRLQGPLRRRRGSDVLLLAAAVVAGAAQVAHQSHQGRDLGPESRRRHALHLEPPRSIPLKVVEIEETRTCFVQ